MALFITKAVWLTSKTIWTKSSTFTNPSFNSLYNFYPASIHSIISHTPQRQVTFSNQQLVPIRDWLHLNSLLVKVLHIVNTDIWHLIMSYIHKSSSFNKFSMGPQIDCIYRCSYRWQMSAWPWASFCPFIQIRFCE